MVMSYQSSSDGKQEAVKGTNGATHVRPMPGPQTVSKNRELTAVSTRQSCTWTDSENVTEVTILIVSDAGTAALDDGAFVCFDATSDALADQWLLEGSYTNSASNRYFIPLNVPRTFRFTSNITRADFKVNGDGGSTAFHVIVEAN